MKIFVLTKRQYMGKDLLDDRFGRFRELPLELARRGHHVSGLALSYRHRSEAIVKDTDEHRSASVLWHSVNLVTKIPSGPLAYWNTARKLIRDFQPDLVWAGSDAYHAICGWQLGVLTNVRCVIDLYDNFEAFGLSKIPGVRSWFRKAVIKADGVTCFNQRLADFIVDSYPRHKATVIIENGFVPKFFFREDREQCRKQLGLPLDARIMGTAGALLPGRDITTLFRAFELLAAEDDRIHLALAGPRPRSLRIPSGPRVHDLKLLPHGQVRLLMNSLDLGVLTYRESPQGRYSFPQKLYEMLACRIPVIGACVGSMQDLLKEIPECLFAPEDPESLAAAARFQFERRKIPTINLPTWEDQAAKLEDFFEAVIAEDAGQHAGSSQ